VKALKTQSPLPFLVSLKSKLGLNGLLDIEIAVVAVTVYAFFFSPCWFLKAQQTQFFLIIYRNPQVHPFPSIFKESLFSE
jgi:hypothetical protein